MQILLRCVDSFLDSILLIYAKFPFFLIGRNKIRFSFLELTLQKSNGGSKNENFISMSNHMVRHIK